MQSALDTGNKSLRTAEPVGNLLLRQLGAPPPVN
jgi:hypothetical protein